jgi:hypothetical protein
VEDRVSQIGRLADELLGQTVFGIFVTVDEIITAERAPDGFESGGPAPLVDRDANTVAPDLAQVDAVVDGTVTLMGNLQAK